MSWIEGKQKKIKKEDFVSITKELTHDFDDIEAKIYLTKFFRNNLYITMKMLCGVEMLTIQEIVLKGILARDNSLIVAGRGWSKSFLISLLSIIYPIFNFDSKMVLISANFRAARRILEQSEKFINGKKGELLRQCFPNSLKRGNDIFQFKLPNGSEVMALPLSTGEGLRGTRAGLACVDEGLLISKDVQENIIRPFLSVKQDITNELSIRKREDQMIKEGVITEKDRISSPKNKYTVFSSASYDFEYLHEMFKGYVDNILEPKPTEDGSEAPTYFVFRGSYESISKEESIFDMTQINSAKNSLGYESEQFKREYRGLFGSGNSSYFNVKKLHECTIPVNQFPTIQIIGDKECEYILTIDPSYASNKHSDFFAMGVYLLIKEERKIVQVHTYGKAGGELKDHFEYFTYLMRYFNIKMVVIDASGDEFIKGYNESITARQAGLNVKFIDADLNSPDIYLEELQKMKNEYNLSSGKIVYGQPFSSKTIRPMHEHMQNQISAGKIWFGSALQPNEPALKKAMTVSLPYEFKNKHDAKFDIFDFIGDQDQWIRETKAQCGLIQVSASSIGNLTYDMPSNIRRNEDEDRPRKDNFTCLLLACWGAKLYYDMIFTEKEEVMTGFVPVCINF